MNPNEIEQVIEAAISDASAQVQSSDNVHFDLTVTSAKFSGKSRIECHRIVNTVLAPFIENGEIHAISIKTCSRE